MTIPGLPSEAAKSVIPSGEDPPMKATPSGGAGVLEAMAERITITEVKQKEESEHCCISKIGPSNPTTN